MRVAELEELDRPLDISKDAASQLQAPARITPPGQPLGLHPGLDSAYLPNRLGIAGPRRILARPLLIRLPGRGWHAGRRGGEPRRHGRRPRRRDRPGGEDDPTGHACRRRKSLLALLFIDLDGFKQINDILGHVAGDARLIDVADTLTALLRQDDTLADGAAMSSSSSVEIPADDEAGASAGITTPIERVSRRCTSRPHGRCCLRDQRQHRIGGRSAGSPHRRRPAARAITTCPARQTDPSPRQRRSIRCPPAMLAPHHHRARRRQGRARGRWHQRRPRSSRTAVTAARNDTPPRRHAGTLRRRRPAPPPRGHAG